MCITTAWETSRIPSGIAGMEIIQLERRIAAGLPLMAHMVHHRGEVGPETGGKLADSEQLPNEDRHEASMAAGITAQ